MNARRRERHAGPRRARGAGYTDAMKLLCVAAAAALLTGCGQRGPLVLPGHGAHPAVVTPAPAAAASAPSTASGARAP